MICRCERVTLADLTAAVEGLDARGLRQLKLWTRAGMGICQGRVCRPALEGVAAILGLEGAAVELSVRPPLRPGDMAVLAGGDGP